MANKTTSKKSVTKSPKAAPKASNPVMAFVDKLSLPTKIILGTVLVVVLFFGYIAFQPNDFLIERQITIESPVAKIFPHINNLKAWEFWNPWLKIDPKMKLTYEGPEEGVGAVCHWAGNDQVGEGTYTITDSQPDNQVSVEVDTTKPRMAKNKMTFFFMLNGNETGIKWRMTGKKTFGDKFIQTFVDLDSTMGPIFQRGLEYIKVATQPGYHTNQ